MRLDGQFIIEFLLYIFAFAGIARTRRLKNWKLEIFANALNLIPIFLFLVLVTFQNYPYWQGLISLILGALAGSLLSATLADFDRRYRFVKEEEVLYMTEEERQEKGRAQLTDLIRDDQLRSQQK